MAALSASLITPESLHDLPAEISQTDSGFSEVLQVGLKPDAVQRCESTRVACV